MVQALIKIPAEVCQGRFFEKYPTPAENMAGVYFAFEELQGSGEESHIVDNLRATDERLEIKTSWRLPFQTDCYVAAFGELWRILRVGTAREHRRGVSLPIIRTTLSLIKCASNPFGYD